MNKLLSPRAIALFGLLSFVSAAGAIATLARPAQADDCCYPGSPCCHPGADCCRNRHRAG